MELSLKDNIQEQEKIQMLFALGKAYESKGNYKRSFEFSTGILYLPYKGYIQGAYAFLPPAPFLAARWEGLGGLFDVSWSAILDSA